MKRGRPTVLTDQLLSEIARRREMGEPHAAIAAALRIPVGTSRFGAWLSRNPDSLRRARLQFPGRLGPPTDTSRVVSASESGGLA